MPMQAVRREDVSGSGGTAPLSLTSALMHLGHVHDPANSVKEN